MFHVRKPKNDETEISARPILGSVQCADNKLSTMDVVKLANKSRLLRFMTLGGKKHRITSIENKLKSKE